MIRKIIIIAGICTLLGFPYGCTEPELSPQANVVEGEPATIALAFQKGEAAVAAPQNTNSVDNDIKHLYILIFDAGTGQPLKTLYKSAYTGGTLQISTLSGVSTIRAVANIGGNPLITGGDTFFDDVTSLADFQEKMAKIGSINPTSGQVLPMSGFPVTDIIIQPGNNTGLVEIPVQRLTAKISIQVLKQIPATDKVDLLSWEVANVPAYSYIQWRSDQDAVTNRTETPGDLNYFSTSAQPFKLVSYNTGSGDILVPGAEFYQFENRKGNIANVNNERERAIKAPAKATYIDIKARYQNSTEVKNVTYRVHLGKNNLTNYDVNRNSHHTYTLTIKGLNKYSTNVVVTDQDSRVVLGDTIFAVDLLEPTLDAHFDWRPVRLRAIPGYSRTEIVDGTGAVVDVNTSWLKLSLNKTWPTNAEISATPALKPTARVEGIQHTLGDGNKTVYIYADEMFTNDVPITTERTLYLRFTFTNTNNPANLNIPDSCYTILKPVTQKPALLMGNMGVRITDKNGNVIAGVGNVVAIERRDEFAMKLGMSGLAATPLTGVRWGFNGILKQPIGAIAFEYYRTNGWDNTINLVYKSPGVPYDQLSIIDIGTPAYAGAFDPIYNTYAARYAIEKNRDLNGNGILDDNEIKWYLPSRAELILMWVGKKGLNTTVNEQMNASYWSSSEDKITGAIDLNFSNGGTGGEILKNYGDYARAVRKMTDPTPAAMKSPYVINGTRRVTGLPSGVSQGHPVHAKGVPYPKHDAEGALNTVSPVFEVAQQDCGVNGTPTLPIDIVPMEWYKAAGRSQDLNSITTTGCNAYWEGSPTDTERGVGMWRLPTQRELMIVWMLRKEFTYDNFTPLKTSRYWSAASYYAENWFTDFSNGYTGVPYRLAGEPLYQYFVRCVRDVTPQ